MCYKQEVIVHALRPRTVLFRKTRRKEVKMMMMMASLFPMATSQRTRAVWRKKYGMLAFQSNLTPFLPFEALIIHMSPLRTAVTSRN